MLLFGTGTWLLILLLVCGTSVFKQIQNYIIFYIYMELLDFSTFSLESALSILIVILALKLARMKITTHSGCFGDKIIIETENPGIKIPIIEA